MLYMSLFCAKCLGFDPGLKESCDWYVVEKCRVEALGRFVQSVYAALTYVMNSDLRNQLVHTSYTPFWLAKNIFVYFQIK